MDGHNLFGVMVQLNRYEIRNYKVAEFHRSSRYIRGVGARERTATSGRKGKVFTRRVGRTWVKHETEAKESAMHDDVYRYRRRGTSSVGMGMVMINRGGYYSWKFCPIKPLRLAQS